MDFYNESILLDHLRSALRSCEGVVKKNSGWNFRCNICGDSKKSQRKKRGHLFKNRSDIWIFNCFNECGAMGAITWLKLYFPDIYKEYLIDVLKRNKDKRKLSSEVYEVIEEKKPVEKPKQIFPFLSLNSQKNRELEISKDAIYFCESRNISEHIWKTFYVCKQGTYINRLIIPFYDNNKKPYYFTGRSLYKNEPKYLGMVGEKKPYNIFNVDKTKPVICLEGPIDSLFVDNAIALSGLAFSEETEKHLKELNLYFLLDYDKSGMRKCIDLIEKRLPVFNWYKFQKEYSLPKRQKWDINDVMLYLNRRDKFSFEEIKKFFTNSHCDLVYFK